MHLVVASEAHPMILPGTGRGTARHGRVVEGRSPPAAHSWKRPSTPALRAAVSLPHRGRIE